MSTVLFLAIDNYGSLGDDNAPDEDDDDDHQSGAPVATIPDNDNYYPDFGVPNIGFIIIIFLN